MTFNLDDNILAISTPSGRSLKAIIRLSGKNVLDCFREIITPKDFEKITDEEGFRSYHSCIYIEKEKISVPVCIYIMKAPCSYTRENVVEIHTFGSPPLLEMLMEMLVFKGRENSHETVHGKEEINIRFAEPGEFTKRAFLNGRINLTEVESVLHIIRSQNDSELLLGVSNLKGKLTRLLSEIQGELTRLNVRVEVAIDFSDQDVELISLDEIRSQIVQVREKLCVVVKKDQNTEIFHEGIKTVIVGWPNVGKSSLFNKLLNYSKAIVTPMSGTTRDALEAVLDLEGINFRIIDTAGIMCGEGELDSLVIERTHGFLEEAQIVLFVIDGNKGCREEQVEFFGSIVTNNKAIVINKGDLPQEIDREDFPSTMRTFPIVKTSALAGEGISELKKMMVSFVFKKDIDMSASEIVFTLRQKIILCRSLEILERVLVGIDQGVSHELVAIDLRCLMDTIGEVAGDVVTEDILDMIFSEFCIGK